MDVFDLFAKLSLDTGDYEKGLDEASGKTSGFADKLKTGLANAAKVGAAAIGAVTTAASAFAAAIIKSADSTASYGDNIDKMSQKMGLSAEAYQEWDAIMQHSGTSIESLQAGMKTLANAVENGNDAFERLGISQEQIAGMNNEELFAATIKALQNVDNETERTYLAGQLLGRGATELGALLNTSAEDTEAMRKAVHDLGGVMSNEAVKASAKYEDTLQDMKTAISGVSRGITSEFLPGLTDLMDGFTRLITGQDYAEEMIASGIYDIEAAIENSIGKISQMASTIAPVFMELFVNILPEIATLGAQILEAIVTAIVENLPTLTGAATTLITTLTTYLIENLPLLLSAAGEIIATVVSGIVSALPEILSAGGQLLDRLTTGIETGLPDMMSRLPQIINGFIGFITDNLPAVLDKGVELITELLNGILAGFPDLIAGLPQVIDGILNFITDNLPSILDKGVELLDRLTTGIISAIPQLLAQLPKIITSFVNFVTQNLPTIIAAGVQILINLAAGIIKAIPDLVKTVPQLIKAFIDGIKSLFSSIVNIGRDVIVQVKNGITGKLKDAASWGKDLIQNFIDGIMAKWNALKDKIKGVAQTVKNFLGFSEPKEGPLSNFHTYAPDMMKLFAKGIADNEGLIREQFSKSLDFGTASVEYGASGMGQVSKGIGAAFSGAGGTLADIVINLTANLDGKPIYEGSYRYARNRERAYGVT